MKKILITGGAGFIGSHIVDRLIAQKNKVIVVDNLSNSHKDTLNPKAIFYKESITSKNIEKIFIKEKPDYVIHNAAQIKVMESFKDPLSDAKINILGTIQLLEYAKKYKVKKFLFASSGGAVYGQQATHASENANPLPESPYGVSKLSAEYYVEHYARFHNLPTVTLRYSNVYGPGQKGSDTGGVVAIFIERLLKGRPLDVFGDGEQTRDFIFVKDIAVINEHALFSDMQGIYNISLRQEVTINTLTKLLQKVMKLPRIKVNYKPARNGEIRRSKIDNKKFLAHFKSFHFIQLEDGLRQTIEQIREKSK